MSNGKKKTNTKKIAVCAMLSALGVVLLYLGSLIQVLDISMAVIASLTCVIAVIEYGRSAPWAIYGVTSILSLLLLPNKTPAVLFALFFGFYPILKEIFEKRNKLLSWVLKEAVFNACLAILTVIVIFVGTEGNNTLLQSPIIIAAALLACEAIFVLYDLALTRLISFYVFQLRDRLKINKLK